MTLNIYGACYSQNTDMRAVMSLLPYEKYPIAH